MVGPLLPAILPQSEFAENIYLSDASSGDRTWDQHKATADQLAQVYAFVEFFRYAERAEQCAGQLWFARDPERGLRLTSASFCRLRLCPICQWRRSRMWVARLREHLPTLMVEYPSARWIHLTLTIRNCEITELRNTLREMNDAWKRLIKRADWPAIGFVRSTEVTRGDDGTAHPHFHALLMVKPSYFTHGYVRHDEWARRWRDAMRVNYLPSVHITAVKHRKGIGNDQDDLMRAILETLKYQTKISGLISSETWLAELTRQTHKLRFISTGGVLKDVLKTDQEESNEELVHAGEPDVPAVVSQTVHRFDWEKPVRKYQHKKTAQRNK